MKAPGLVLFILIAISSNAQIHLFQKKFNGFVNYLSGNGVAPTHDGGMIVIADGHNSSASYAILIRTNANGDTLWTRSFRRGNYNLYHFNSVQQTADNGFVFTGTNDVFFDIVKTNTNGDTLWTRQIDKSVGSADYSMILQDSDHGYLVAGTSTNNGNRNIIAMKLDSTGTLLWQRIYDLPDLQNVFSIKKNTAGFIMAGYTELLSDYLLFQIDNFGDFQWAKKYSGPGIDYCNSLDVTNTGGFILSGYSIVTLDVNEPIFMICTDQGGDVIWSKKYVSNLVQSMSVRSTADGGFLTVGSTRTSANDPKGIIFKTDGNGSFLWGKKFDTNLNSGLNAVDIANDGSYIIAGSKDVTAFTTTGILAMKTDSSVSSSCNENLFGVTESNVVVASSSLIFTSDTFNVNIINNKPVVIKGITQSVFCNVIGIDEVPLTNPIHIYPNPAGKSVHIDIPFMATVEIYSPAGSKIYSSSVESMNHTIQLNTAPGVYFAVVKNEKHYFVSKLIID